jgi:hypothetical protein
VLVCAGGALLGLLAASRTWAVELQRRPAPQAPLSVAHSGSALYPWLTGLALVGLAGSGALLATRGRGRAVVGAVLVLSGAGTVLSAGYGLATLVGLRPGWPLLCLLCGLLVAAAGVRALLRGGSWPAMNGRYERPGGPAGAEGAGSDRYGVPGQPGPRDRVESPVPAAEERIERGGPSSSDVAMWDALDRGEDPTRPAS